jgi:aldose 1-epimerase
MPEPTVPLTGTQHELASGDYRAVVTELGAGLRSLTYRDQPVVIGYQADELPPAGAGQLLVPWPNRIDHGRYSFGGGSFQLALTEPARGTAIHGLTRWVSWPLVAVAEDSVELGLRLLGSPGYPFSIELRAGYRLTAGEGLHVTVTAHNAGAGPAPYGTGSHPYLRAGDGLIDDWQLELPAARWLPADERGIPVAEPQPVAGTEYDFTGGRKVGSTVLDHAFTELTTDQAGRAWVRLASQQVEVALWAGHGYRWLQAFTGDPLGPAQRRRAVAVEPMTCPPNAFASGTDLLTIEPGATVTHRWGLQARHLS